MQVAFYYHPRVEMLVEFLNRKFNDGYRLAHTIPSSQDDESLVFVFEQRQENASQFPGYFCGPDCKGEACGSFEVCKIRSILG